MVSLYIANSFSFMHQLIEKFKKPIGYISYTIASILTILAILIWKFGFEFVFLKRILFKQQLDIPCAILFVMIAIMFFALGISLTVKKEIEKEEKIVYLKVRNNH